MDVSAELARYLKRTTFESLPDEVVQFEKKLILDSLGVAVAGFAEPGVGEVIRLVEEWGGQEVSTILGRPRRVPPPMAALANSVMMHALDYDDTEDNSALHTHVSALPASLSVGETIDASGKALILGTALGVELICRLGSATRTPLSWIRTSTCGSFGAAAAAGKLLGLNEKEIANTLGIVYSQTSGNAQCLVDGGLAKRMQPGFSAKAGVFSAFLSQKGLTGATHTFEGPYGFFYLYEKGQFDRDRITEGLGKQYKLLNLSIKTYPTCRMTHAAVQAAIAIHRSRKIDPEQIQCIEVQVPRMVHDMVGAAYQIRENPRVDAQFSIPYTVAAALINGKLDLADFTESSVRNQRILRLAAKVHVSINPEWDEKDIKHARILCRVRNELHEMTIDRLKGSPDDPLNMEECFQKFKQCLNLGSMPNLAGRADSIMESIVNLEKTKSIRSLLAMFEPQ